MLEPRGHSLFPPPRGRRSTMSSSGPVKGAVDLVSHLLFGSPIHSSSSQTAALQRLFDHCDSTSPTPSASPHGAENIVPHLTLLRIM